MEVVGGVAVLLAGRVEKVAVLPVVKVAVVPVVLMVKAVVMMVVKEDYLGMRLPLWRPCSS